MTLHYTDKGKGNTLVLLHGFCESKEMWFEFVDELSDDFRVICIDLPGFGSNTPLSAPISIEEMADHVYMVKKYLILIVTDKKWCNFVKTV